MAFQRQRFLPGSFLLEAAITITIQASAPLCICGFCKDSDTLLANVHLDTGEHKGLLDRLLEASPAHSAGASRKVQDAMLLDADGHLEQQDPVISTFEL